MGGGRNKSKKKKSYSRAQQMARKRLGLSSPTSTGGDTGSNNSGVSGIGPVSSGDSYAKSLSTATNQPTKRTSGVGPVASGSQYASMLKKNPARFSSGTMAQQKAALKSGNNSLLAGGYGLRPDGTMGEYKDGDISTSAEGSSMEQKYQYKEDLKKFVPFNETASLGNQLMAGNFFQNLGKSYLENRRKELADPDENKTGTENFFNNSNRIQQMLDDQNSSLSTETFGDIASTTPMAIQTYGTGGITEDASSASGYSEGGSPLTKTEAMSAFGIGGLNLDNIGGTERALPTGNPNVMSPDGTFNRPGPGGSEPEADYTSYQPGSFYNQSDTDRMNVTNLLRSGRNLITSPFRAVGIDNQFTNQLIPKSNEAIQDGIDQRGPRPTLTKPKSRGARPLAAVPTVIEELLPQATPVASASTTPTTQTGTDANRLLQIQQQAYQQAYNPMSIGGFNPQFRFASRTPRIDYSTYFNYS